jgi:hypothetical protein
MIFGVSCFHAFGHEYACQSVYHPQKRQGFGHTDGEGCERIWGHIQKDIPNLRVSGVSIFFPWSINHEDFPEIPLNTNFSHSLSITTASLF